MVFDVGDEEVGACEVGLSEVGDQVSPYTVGGRVSADAIGASDDGEALATVGLALGLLLLIVGDLVTVDGLLEGEKDLPYIVGVTVIGLVDSTGVPVGMLVGGGEGAPLVGVMVDGELVGEDVAIVGENVLP